MSFLFEKGWIYITGDGLTAFFYFFATVGAVEEEGGDEDWGARDGLL